MSRVNVVFDCRGVTGIEYAYDHGYLEIEEAPYTIRSMAQRIENIERYVAHKASRMTCVSQAMRSFVSERWNVPRQKIDVVPCCTDVASGIKAAQDREKLREQLGLRDSFVVLFSGSLASYQTPNESLKFFGHVLAIRPDAHFFGLTTHPERLVRAIQDSSIPISKTTVKSVLHDDVFRYLSVGDCGLLIRESCKVNKVASPVKFAEYLAAGVPVVLSQGIGDYSRFVEQNSLGAVLPGQPSSLATQDVEAALKRIQHSSRRGIQRVAGMHLDWSTCIELIERSWSTKD